MGISGVLVLLMGAGLTVLGFSPIDILLITTAVLGVGVTATGAIVILIAWGLWKGKNWARILYLISLVLGVVAGILTVFSPTIFHIASSFSLDFTGVVPIIIDGVLIWYMFRPNVKTFFKSRQ
jgi:hypothetical protein